MTKRKVLVWETLATVSGGQKMTLLVLDMLKDEYEFCCLIPAEGLMSEELKKRNIHYVLMGDQTLPTGVKGKQVVFRYGWMSLKNICKSLGVIRRYKPDLLYAPGPAALPWSAVCGSLTGKPGIWHLHHIFLDGATRKLLNICSQWKSIKKIIAVSNCVGEQIVNQKGKEKVEVIYNPVDVDKYAKGTSDKVIADIENMLNRKISGGVLIVSQIAVITKNKAQIDLVRAIAGLKKAGVNAIGLFVGDIVTDADTAYKNEVKQEASNLECSENICFLGFRNDITNILAASDCIFVPSQEGLPLAALEAMSAKKPVIASGIGGARELLCAADCGYIYENNTEEEMADAILKAARRKNVQSEEKGYTFCCEQSYDNFKATLNQLFDGI